MKLPAFKDTVFYKFLKEQQLRTALKIRDSLDWNGLWNLKFPNRKQAPISRSTREYFRETSASGSTHWHNPRYTYPLRGNLMMGDDSDTN